jgi:hypothetical protein
MRLVVLLALILIALACPALAVECPPSAQLEEEPPLVAGYVDLHNGGCDADPTGGAQAFQPIGAAEFCGVAGWYRVDESLRRDTDWFTYTLPPSGSLRVGGIADRSTYVFVRTRDCEAPTVLASVGLVSHEWRYLTHHGAPGTEMWLFVASPLQDEPDEPVSWEYRLEFQAFTPVEQHRWSTVKALFD